MADTAAGNSPGKAGVLVKYLVGALLLVLALVVIFVPTEKFRFNVGSLIKNNEIPITVLLMISQLFQTTLNTTLQIDRIKSRSS